MPSRLIPHAPRPSHRSASPQATAAAGAGEPGDHVEQGGLAGAVGADQPEDLPLPQLQAHAIEGQQAAEAAADRLHLEQGHGASGG